MERKLIEALASLKGGKKKLRELLESAREGLDKAREDMREVSGRVRRFAEAVDLIEKLSAREETQKENSIGE